MYKIRIELLDIYIHTHTQSNSIISLKNKVCLYTPFSRIRDFTNWQAQASNLIGLKLKRGLNYNLIFSPVQSSGSGVIARKLIEDKPPTPVPFS